MFAISADLKLFSDSGPECSQYVKGFCELVVDLITVVLDQSVTREEKQTFY